jgi:hypothetical protein
VDAPLAWGQEGSARDTLFALAWDTTPIDGYILFLDADMIPARNPRFLMETEAEGICFRLYDLWETDPLRYREDEFWRGHRVPRAWMIRKRKRRPEKWGSLSGKGIHSGHLPGNIDIRTWAYSPNDLPLLHYAYSTPKLRETKHAQYMSVANELSDFEKRHAASIVDPNPQLHRLPFDPEYTL